MPSLGQTLLERGDINLIQLNLALDFRVFYGGRLGTNLLELGIIDETILGEALAQHMGLPCASADDLEVISYDLLKYLSREVAYRAQALPFRMVGQQVCVAFVDPRNERAVREVRAAIPRGIVPHVSPELRLYAALERHYQIRMEPRFKTLSAKVMTRHDLRPPTVAPVLRQNPLPRKPEADAGWITDEELSAWDAKRRPPIHQDKVMLSVQKISLLLEEAKSRDEIAELALEYAQRYLKRVALFVLRKDIGFGWDARGGELTRERVKAIMIPLGEPSIFQTVLESQGHYLGALSDTPINNHFLAALGGARPRNALLLPLNIGGITFGAIYGDNGEGGMIEEGINELQVMVSRANIAFEKLIIADRQKALRRHERQ